MSCQKNCSADICWNESHLPCCAVVLEPTTSLNKPPGYTQLFRDHCRSFNGGSSTILEGNIKHYFYEVFVESNPSYFLSRNQDVDVFKNSFYHEVMLNDGTSYYKKCTDKERDVFVQQELNENKEIDDAILNFVEDVGFEANVLVPTSNVFVEKRQFEAPSASVEETRFVADKLETTKNESAQIGDGVITSDTAIFDKAISKFVEEIGFGPYYLTLPKNATMIILQSNYDSTHLPDLTKTYREYRKTFPRKKIPLHQIESKFYIPLMTKYPQFFPSVDMKHLSGIFYMEVTKGDDKCLVPIPDQELDGIIQKDIQANGKRKKTLFRLPKFIASMRKKLVGRQHELKPVLERMLTDIEGIVLDNIDSNDTPRNDEVVKQCMTVINKFFDTIFDAPAKKKLKTTGNFVASLPIEERKDSILRADLSCLKDNSCSGIPGCRPSHRNDIIEGIQYNTPTFKGQCSGSVLVCKRASHSDATITEISDQKEPLHLPEYDVAYKDMCRSVAEVIVLFKNQVITQKKV